MFFLLELRNYKTNFTLGFKDLKIDREIKTFEKC